MGQRSTGDIDKKIGNMITKLRIAAGLTMQEFANRIGITQQQAHKYEKGLNRVSVARLCMIAEALDVPPSYFFEEMPGPKNEGAQRQRKNMDLVKYFQAIPSLQHQDAISILVRVLAEY